MFQFCVVCGGGQGNTLALLLFGRTGQKTGGVEDPNTVLEGFGIDDAAIDALKAAVLPVIKEVTGESVVCRSASTDCNIPLSLGVPALCVGITRHSGIHTRQETLDKRYLDAGLEIALRLAATL